MPTVYSGVSSMSRGRHTIRYDLRIGGFWEDFDHKDRAAFALQVPDFGTGHREIYGGIFPLDAADMRRMIGAAFRETGKQPYRPIEHYVERFSPIDNLTNLIAALRCMLFRVHATNTTGHSA